MRQHLRRADACVPCPRVRGRATARSISGNPLDGYAIKDLASALEQNRTLTALVYVSTLTSVQQARTGSGRG